VSAENTREGDSIGAFDRAVRYLNYRYTRFKRNDRMHPWRQRHQAAAERAAHEYFESVSGRRRLVDLFAKSRSTGAGWTDYHLLHRYVIARRPRRMLEFGSGITTLVMAEAIDEIRREGAESHLWSLENLPMFYENVRSLVPDDLAPHVTLLCAPKQEDFWRNDIWGFRYGALPKGSFDFVFVDGPTEYRGTLESGFVGPKGTCLDLLFVLARDPDCRTDVLVDQRFASLEAYQSVLPSGAVRYDPVMDVGILAGVSGRLLGPKRARRLRGADVWRLMNLLPA
jgi:predicted O-methyltransferase YrrM